MAVVLSSERAVQRAVIVSLSKHYLFFGFSFGPVSRLHRPQEFSAVFSARKVVRGKFFSLHYLSTEAGERARLGIIVPKRLAKAATLRNAVKRQGREAFRLKARELPPYDLVLRLARPLDKSEAGGRYQHREWRAEMEALLGRVTTQGYPP